MGTGDDINALHTNGMSRLSVAARSGDPQKVYDLLQAGAVVQPMAEPQYGFQVPLYEAVSSASLACVETLLAAGANPNFGPSGDPVLASAPTPEIMRALLDAGADPHAKRSFSQLMIEGPAANHEASKQQRVEMLHMLVAAGLDLDELAEIPVTACYRAGSIPDPDMLEALLAAGADPFKEPTALKGVCFIWKDDLDAEVERVVDICVEVGLDVNEEDAAGYRPIHSAVLYDSYGEGYASSDGTNAAAVAALIKHGAEFEIPLPRDGWTPLHIAAHEGSMRSVAVLLDAGADARRRTSDGRLALDLARECVTRREQPLSEFVVERSRSAQQLELYEQGRLAQIEQAKLTVARLERA